MDRLKLIALDRDDLEVVSTHLQDAVVKVADILWRPAEKRLVVGAQPVRLGGRRRRPRRQFRRRRAALRFERVIGLQVPQCARRRTRTQVLNLLAVDFEETDAPAGVVDADVLRRRGAAARGRMPGGRAGRSRPDLGHRMLPGATSMRLPSVEPSRPPNRVDAPSGAGH